ncbi:MAG: hypothetical protein M3347_10575, partial [Armatimonadota bacterium]|nr:hypothetical protein [Armatimonadota bacterium]
GNHDLDWDEPVYDWKPKRQANIKSVGKSPYVEQGNLIGVRDDNRYPLRFKKFSESFYHPLMQQPYPLSVEEQCIPFLFPDTGIQFLSMNSEWQVDEYFPDRASIHPGALSRGLDKAQEQIEQARKSGQIAHDAAMLRIAVWHHPVTGNEKIEDDAFLERLRQADFKICLHGHVHEDRTEVIGYLHPTRKIYVAGAGSFGAPVNARPGSIPRLYNVLEIQRDHSSIRVYTRSRRKDTGAWGPWAVWPTESPHQQRSYYEIQFQ